MAEKETNTTHEKLDEIKDGEIRIVGSEFTVIPVIHVHPDQIDDYEFLTEYLDLTLVEKLEEVIDDFEDKYHWKDNGEPIRKTRIWKWFDKEVKPVMCDSDETLFARMTSWLWKDLDCPCCGLWRGAFLAFPVGVLFGWLI